MENQLTIPNDQEYPVAEPEEVKAIQKVYLSDSMYKKILPLLRQGYQHNHICKILGISKNTVTKAKQRWEMYDITHPVTVSKAATALHRNLESGSMQAVKMVYNQVNEVSGLNAEKRKAAAPQINLTLNIERLKAGEINDIVDADHYDDREQDPESIQ